VNNRAQIFEALAGVYKSHNVDEKARRVRSRISLTWKWKAHSVFSRSIGLPTDTKNKHYCGQQS
jgi:hypothetical protein